MRCATHPMPEQCRLSLVVQPFSQREACFRLKISQLSRVIRASISRSRARSTSSDGLRTFETSRREPNRCSDLSCDGTEDK